MPKNLSLAEITTILQAGDFNQLIGGLEDEHLECKREPYKLQLDTEKMELAKDVSALLNADGGIILVGVRTEKDLSTLAARKLPITSISIPRALTP